MRERGIRTIFYFQVDNPLVEVADPAFLGLHRQAAAEISAAIVFLLTAAAGFIKGTCIAIDGGASRNTKLFPLQAHQRSTPFDGFHRAVKPKVLEKY